MFLATLEICRQNQGLSGRMPRSPLHALASSTHRRQRQKKVRHKGRDELKHVAHLVEQEVGKGWVSSLGTA